ncbi:hypothetical protein GE21DRAFT_6779 [Neurospora crassa]|uniref:Uncharacterized protein n=1 Tax=Neurospora crassa (strain ATCC 24698 / 74-OR23-1A / CBS 708.71 / DSM 1257 / FGSC 987) TaxID=367110 RepID=Q7S8H0_NEUCR|nr:hypothetical protein NCU05163 [Neurospora crassa OR74A]EAA32631.2 hypothetical protein NCU05163 [Neurospora crassa OR74A]KHE79066.1 hypothetical protein GE21DRAFT_6779 [Neurospora crassa]|eukprot:XP_961867.2 hypothetical protein NCU05163 [Neurospora crassa OR74A]
MYKNLHPVSSLAIVFPHHYNNNNNSKLNQLHHTPLPNQTTAKMQFLTTISLLAAAAVSSVSAAPTSNQYTEVMGKVTFGLERQCPIDHIKYPAIEFPANTESNHCRTFYAGAVFQSIDVEFFDPKCQLTVYSTYDCSDSGIVSGSGGCWNPEGGIKAYKATCPWKL